MAFVQLAALALAGCGCAIDLRTRRIPNALTLGGATGALLYQAAQHGFTGLGTSLGGWGVGAAFLLIPYAVGGMGAGDVKLMGALGAWLGPREVLAAAMFATLAGGVMSLVVALAHGYLRQACRNIWLVLTHWRIAGLTPLPELTLATSRGPRLAYGAPILVGTVVSLWLH